MKPGLIAGGRTKRVRVEERLHRLGALMFARSYCVTHGATLGEVIDGDDTGRERGARVVRARHRLWTVLLDTLGLSYPDCAALFEVDHTTVMHAVRKRRAELEAEVAA